MISVIEILKEIYVLLMVYFSGITILLFLIMLFAERICRLMIEIILKLELLKEEFKK